jgi:hypothetical protein
MCACVGASTRGLKCAGVRVCVCACAWGHFPALMHAVILSISYVHGPQKKKRWEGARLVSSVRVSEKLGARLLCAGVSVCLCLFVRV